LQKYEDFSVSKRLPSYFSSYLLQDIYIYWGEFAAFWGNFVYFGEFQTEMFWGFFGKNLEFLGDFFSV
jgi:hypothetical protein